MGNAPISSVRFLFTCWKKSHSEQFCETYHFCFCGDLYNKYGLKHRDCAVIVVFAKLAPVSYYKQTNFWFLKFQLSWVLKPRHPKLCELAF